MRPPFTEQDAIQMMHDLYGLTVTASELPSEIDRNFKVTDANGTSYVLKIAHNSRTFDVLDLQNQAIIHLADKVDFCPTIIPSQSGELMPNYNDHHIRLMNYLEGTLLGDFKPHSESLLSHIGSQLGQLSTALASFDHHAHRTDYQWNILNFPNIVEQMIQYIPQEKHQSIIRHFSDHYAATVEPQLSDLRSGFIHSDANDYNVLVHATDFNTIHMTGLIDFGDMVYSPIIAELAIALAYIMMGKVDPLAAAVPVIRGYNQQFPLEERELKTLYAFIAARLCMSVCIGAFQQQREPDNEYLTISKQGAWRLLEQLQAIHPNLAHYVFRDACGFTPCPQEETIVNWLTNADIHPILGENITNFTVFDLSVGSTEIGNLPDIQHTPTFTHLLFDRLTNSKIGIGRYNEPRLLYFGDAFESTDTERRTIHIGIDLFQAAGTPIYAPLDGTIYSVHDNAGYKDYGPTIILEHKTDENVPFYTLYGHLSRESLNGLQSGQIINKGDKLAEMGDYPINGDWPPHLHFQIITDMLGLVSDFPGVAPNSQRDVWLSISPNPNIVVKVDAQTAVQHQISHDDLLDLRRTYLNPSLSISYKKHLKIERGYMQHLYDENGRAYLDCVNNVPHVGHSNPRVVKAAQRQMAVLNTNTRYLHDTIIEYAEKLADTFPDPLNVCFLVCSGSEANELALRLARTYTGGHDMIVIDHAYHGNTGTLVDLSPYKFNSKGGQGQKDYVHVAPIPDGYRGPYKGCDIQVGQQYAEEIRPIINNMQANGRKLAAFIGESVLGCGGQVVLPDNYFQTAYQIVREAGGVCIADEVQVGFGRVGSHFWGFETQGVIPDIVTMGKPIGNGHPLGAVITTKAIADAFNNGMEYFNTFGGNPVSCAIGLEVLNVIQDENLQQNAYEVGNYLMNRLRDLMPKYELIGDVRGLGLYIGVELVLDKTTLEPAAKHASYIIERMKDEGVLISIDGPLHNVLKIKPPIIFSKADADTLVNTLDAVMGETVVNMF